MKLLPMLVLQITAALPPQSSPVPNASLTMRGLVSTEPQAFEGQKNFDGGIATRFIDAGTIRADSIVVGVLDLTTLTCAAATVSTLSSTSVSASLLDAGTVAAGLYTTNDTSTGQVRFQSLCADLPANSDFIFDTSGPRTNGYLMEWRKNGSSLAWLAPNGSMHSPYFVTDSSGGFLGPYWYATYPYGNTTISYRQHLDTGADLYISGGRDPSDSTDRTASGIVMSENGSQTFAVSVAGDVVAGTQWSTAAYHCGGGMGSGAICLKCDDPGTGCYVPIMGHMTNGSLHGVFTVANGSWMDGGLLLNLENPGGPNGESMPSASTDGVFTVDFAGGFGQPLRALARAQFPPCPDPAPPLNEFGHGSHDSLLNWAADLHKYYVCKTSDLPDAGHSGYVEIADTGRLKSGTLVLSAGTGTISSGNATACVCGKVTNASNPVTCSAPSGGSVAVTGTGTDQVAYVCF